MTQEKKKLKKPDTPGKAEGGGVTSGVGKEKKRSKSNNKVPTSSGVGMGGY